MVNQIIAIILIHLVFNSFCEQSPDPDLISPCTWVDQKTIDLFREKYDNDIRVMRYIKLGINCVGGEDYIYLSKIFEEIDEKHEGSKEFGHLNIKELEMIELEENTFHNSTFEKSISITNCKKMLSINENAFTETAKVTKSVIFEGNHKLNIQSLFNVLNKFTAVQSIELVYNSLTDIPSEAFINQAHLRRLVINDPLIKTLGQSSFKGLANIKHIEIFNTQIEFIPDFAFEIQESSKYPLFINFHRSRLSRGSFAPNTFAKIGRPTFLNFDLGYNSHGWTGLEYLKKIVFLPFLQADPLNMIKINGNTIFDCTNCKNYWIKSNNLYDRLFGLTCSNGLDLDDPSNFEDCKDDD